MQRKHVLAPGEWYHIYNRGVNKADIFFDESDYRRFLELLYLANSNERVDIQKLLREGRTFTELLSYPKETEPVSIAAFCLMQNHFHILIKTSSEKGISKFMQKLITGYVMYFNKKHDRTGPLFQGKFRSVHVNNDNHLNYIFSYIHLNPIKINEPLWEKASQAVLQNNILNALEYPYSSIGKYLDKKTSTDQIITKEIIPWKFTSKEDCQKELLSWFNTPE